MTWLCTFSMLLVFNHWYSHVTVSAWSMQRLSVKPKSSSLTTHVSAKPTSNAEWAQSPPHGFMPKATQALSKSPSFPSLAVFATACLWANVIFFSGSLPAHAGLLDDYGTDPTKIVNPVSSSSSTTTGEKGQNSIDPSLRACTYPYVLQTCCELFQCRRLLAIMKQRFRAI
jgi:hypothetical protein